LLGGKALEGGGPLRENPRNSCWRGGTIPEKERDRKIFLKRSKTIRSLLGNGITSAKKESKLASVPSHRTKKKVFAGTQGNTSLKKTPKKTPSSEEVFFNAENTASEDYIERKLKGNRGSASRDKNFRGVRKSTRGFSSSSQSGLSGRVFVISRSTARSWVRQMGRISTL